jgi:hypothetical protein
MIPNALRLGWLAGLSLMIAGAASTAAAAAPDAQCRAPAELVQSRATFHRLARAVKAREPIRILVMGTSSSLGAGTSGPDAAYPARLAARLSSEWGGLPVSIVNVARAGMTASDMAGRMPALLAETRAQLVVWQTGTVDAMRGVDLNEFAQAIDRGIGVATAAGADLLIVDPQYGGPLASLRNVEAYLDYLVQVVRGWNVALFRRYAIMRHWSETGLIDLAPSGRPEQRRTADRVHECLAQLLAETIKDTLQ